MVDSTIQILDTGKINKDDSGTSYTQLNSGTWIDLSGFTLSGDFTNLLTSNEAARDDSTDSGLFTFNSNEKTMIQAPRLILRGLVLASATSTITNIINLGRKKSVLKMKGGLGFIEAMPEYSDGIYVIIKNTNFSEVYKDTKSTINFTINLEQV